MDEIEGALDRVNVPFLFFLHSSRLEEVSPSFAQNIV